MSIQTLVLDEKQNGDIKDNYILEGDQAWVQVGGIAFRLRAEQGTSVVEAFEAGKEDADTALQTIAVQDPKSSWYDDEDDDDDDDDDFGDDEEEDDDWDEDDPEDDDDDRY